MKETIDLKDIFPKDGIPQRIYCDTCNEPMSLVFDDFVEIVSSVDIEIGGLPYLHCATCETKQLPDRSRFSIIELHRQAIENSSRKCRVVRKKKDGEFGLTKVPFIYDADDYYYIPGLFRPQDSGFLTPVFFKSSVLLKFQNHPNYRVRFASKSYGTIQMDEGNDISFGVNRSGKVIMWLGDLASLPEDEQFYLRSENVASDHDVGSEFYDGQIEAIFTDYSPEEKLLQSRSKFFDFYYQKFGQDLSHLTTETLEAISQLNPPVLHTIKEQKDIIDLLNKINIEALSSSTLVKSIAALGQKPKEGASLKKLEFLFSTKFPTKEISKIVSPLFVLSDLRNALLHAVSNKTKEKTLSAVCDRLGIPENSSFEDIYPTLIEKLTVCYDELSDLQ